MAKAHLGRVLHGLSDGPAASAAFLSAIKILEQLARTEPKLVAYPDELAFVLWHQGAMLLSSPDQGEAEKSFSRARQLWQGLVEQTTAPEYQANSRTSWRTAGDFLRDPKRAVELARLAGGEAPANPVYWAAQGAACIGPANGPLRQRPCAKRSGSAARTMPVTGSFLLCGTSSP